MKIRSDLANQGKVIPDAKKVTKLLGALLKEWNHIKTSVCEIMRIQPIFIDKMIGQLMSYEAKHVNEDNNLFPSKLDYDDTRDQISSEGNSRTSRENEGTSKEEANEIL